MAVVRDMFREEDRKHVEYVWGKNWEEVFFPFQILARIVPYCEVDPFLQGDPLDVFNANGLKTDT